MHDAPYVPLYAFPGTAEWESKQFEISGRGSLNGNAEGSFLELEYRVRERVAGGLDAVIFPEDLRQGERRDGLWQHLCFEAFFSGVPVDEKARTKPSNGQPYFEWNASSSGDWNLYSFENYREGMAGVGLELDPVLTFHRREGEYFARCRIPVPAIIGRKLLLSLAVVFETRLGLSYWSTAHEGEAPDFHLAASRQMIVGA
ncbi:MAG: hypothetical protein H7301_12000 [Cryobacterium sp.]|nr:hypothetical protein [Oligoflexia bacterium]